MFTSGFQLTDKRPQLDRFISHAVISTSETRHPDIDPSLVSVCLLFIADSDRGDPSTHGGLFNYTLLRYMSINNPTDAIIHVVILVNRFKKTGARLQVMLLRP